MRLVRSKSTAPPTPVLLYASFHGCAAGSTDSFVGSGGITGFDIGREVVFWGCSFRTGVVTMMTSGFGINRTGGLDAAGFGVNRIGLGGGLGARIFGGVATIGAGMIGALTIWEFSRFFAIFS